MRIYQVIVFLLLSAGVWQEGHCQRNSGIFYTTILTKTGAYKRLTGFGDAKAYFLKDVNGDEKDDAVRYQRTGEWYVALSDGAVFRDPARYLFFQSPNGECEALMGDVNGDGKQDAANVDAAGGNWHVALSQDGIFKQPEQWAAGQGAGSTERFLSDVNGDGKADAVVFSLAAGTWKVGLSNGVNGFGGFTSWIGGFGQDGHRHFVADVNGDGKADAVSYDSASGDWKVALSNGSGFVGGRTWRTGFGKGAAAGIVYDVDRDGKADIIYYSDGNWNVCYSSGAAFDASSDQRWVTGNRPATINSRSNKPAPEAMLTGSISGVATGACAVSAGDWLMLENGDKKTTVDATLTDNWDAWGNDYTPQLPGHEGIYDAGDPVIDDEQIRMIHDAGFTYIMLDITNGKNGWVDGRARRLIERIRHWNSQITGQQHKMYFCISMGGSRGLNGQAAADVCEEESRRTWEEFYQPYQDAYYLMDGKPLLIHFVWEPENSRDVQDHAKGLVNYHKFTIRWMYNKILDSPSYANGYGWPVLNMSGNPVGEEVMDVMPGFWNGSTSVARDHGEFYRSLWLRVLQHKPQSVWLNSYNETWEHTCVEPSWMYPSAAAEYPDILQAWTDYYGKRMDDFYWVMTREYNRLFMYDELFRGCYLQEDESSMIYVVKEHSIEAYGMAKPSMAPVLLVPKGFVTEFAGKVIDDALRPVGRIDRAVQEAPAPISYEDIRVGGELETRALKNYDRLETDIYTPEKVFPVQHEAVSADWPGDYEGRIILGLTLQAQATHREPRYLAEMIRMIPGRLNAKGYLGPVRDDSISEQQLSGHGWFLRGLCEYYEWKKDPAVKKYILDIIQNLALPTLGYHKTYPIDPAVRRKDAGGAAGTIQNSFGRWLLSSDVGCDFIFLDGIVQAYGLFPSEPLKQLIEEIMGRFFQMDPVAIRAQTHATLTGLRAVLRYYGITHQPYLLREAEKRYKLYRGLAMTGNYENYNWFERPEWTEPCAIVDSYMLATQLWQYTGDPAYLEDAHHIYYNALGHTERANGGFGLDNCPRAGNPSLNVMADEAYWCCTMRGGEGMAAAIRYNYFTQGQSLFVPFFNNSETTIKFRGKHALISQVSGYPFEGRTELVVKSSDLDRPVSVRLFAPSWVQNPIVRVDGQLVPVTRENGFMAFTARLTRGQRIVYTFDMQAGIQDPVNPEHEEPGYFSFAYGPLLLGYENENRQEISFDTTPVLTRIAERKWKAGADGVELTPVYHLLDPKVSKESGYSKQVLFTVRERPWQAKWISTMVCQNIANTWLAYRKKIIIETKPAAAKARIAADSKYWLWINGQQVVFEGGLKRGPDPRDTYFDEIDIAPYLRQGENTIAVLVWYFGKDGFSHKSSGKAGLLFDCQAGQLHIQSDKTWKCALLDAYQTAPAPSPNFRLSESSILFDARRDPGAWQGDAFDDNGMPFAMESGSAGCYPWNGLVRRPTPQWKDSGIKQYVRSLSFPMVSSGDTIVCQLPYDAQVTPYLKIEAAAGQKIIMATDNYLFYCPEGTVRAEYITKKGVQEYESPGWMNGHKMYYFIPRGIKVLGLGYRETGYNSEFAGSFSCQDTFLDTIWEKARRTLYVNMRDGYMDCPERERAAWTGDAVNESGQAFYALSPSSHALTRKWLYELIHWQREDGAIYSPVPAGNWVNELPCQSVTSIGEYGLWNYYLNTGDRKTIADLYAGAKRYLDLWKEDGKGTVMFRRGDWTWGDWGDNIDTVLLYNLLYYTGVKGMDKIALELGNRTDARRYEELMATFKVSFNRQFWNGRAYRSPGYTGQTDDRVQALAVVTGVAGEEKFPALLTLFRTEEHASPYMEKYVLEALFRMNDVDEAIARLKKRFGPMVRYPGFSTLFEGWGPGKEGFGGGTINHAWSGGALTILSRYLCGIAPVEPGYRTFSVLPQPGAITHASAAVSSVAGRIATSFTNETGKFGLSITVPKGTSAIAGIPDKGYRRIMLGGQTIWKNGKYILNDKAMPVVDGSSGFIKFKVTEGEWSFSADK